MPEKRAAKKRTTKKTTTTARKRAGSTRPTSAPRGSGRPRDGALRVRQVRSGIGHAETYRRTLRALGLKHHQDVVTVSDTPSVRGMLHKVRHLVHVTAEEA